jgi:GTP-binding protein
MATRHAHGPTVVLVGRPNVGKSTLFNRITGSRRAIVTPVPGTTRDVIAHPAEWQGAHFTLVDTGGVFGASADPLHALVVEHGKRAIGSADAIVFVVDGREGVVPGDEEIAKTIRPVGVPVIIAVNKTDDKRAGARVGEFHRFGFEPVLEIAAEHGDGVGDLLDDVLSRVKGVRAPRASRKTDISSGETITSGKMTEGETRASRVTDLEGADLERAREGGTATPATSVEGAAEASTEASAEVSVAIIGRPNVGKSSLVNRLLREERVMVSDLPGTTRDPIDTLLRWHGHYLRIVDTAGIRRAGKVAKSEQIESLSVLLARRAIARADIAVLLLDSTEGPTDQDAAIAGEAERVGCGVIIVANKWDLMKGKGEDTAKRFDDEVRRRFKFLDFAPILHISAKTGERAPKLLEMIEKVARARQHRVPTAALNRFIEAVTTVHAPVSPGKREVRVLYAAQTAVAPPTFVLFTNVATTFHFSYERFIVNRLREAFGFVGTPIRLHVRKRGGKSTGENR